MTKNNPAIEVFRAFSVLAETGNVHVAARKLGIAEPSVSRKLKVFNEKSKGGFGLLKMNGQRLELTVTGRDILPDVRELIRQYDSIIDHLAERVESPSRVLIATGFFGAEYFLPRILDKEELSDVIQMEIQILRGQDRILGVAQGKYDFGILSHERSDVFQVLEGDDKPPDAVQIEHLNMQMMVVIAARKTYEAKKLQSMPAHEPIPLPLLEELDLLGLDRNSGIRRKLERQFSQGQSVHFVTEGGGWAAARELARKGVGAAIQPLATLRVTDRQDFIIRRLPDELAVEKLLIYRTRTLPDKLKHILEQLKTVAQTHENEIEKVWKRWSKNDLR